MLKRELTVSVTTQVARPGLLDEIVAQTTEEEQKATPGPATGAESPEPTVLVAVQLIEFVQVCIPCPGCGCYPCKPGHMNGHSYKYVPVAGAVILIHA